MAQATNGNRMIDLENWRKKLIYQSGHRGTKELDLLLGNFARKRLATFDAARLQEYADIISAPEPLIYSWITTDEPIPTRFDNAVMQALRTIDYLEPST